MKTHILFGFNASGKLHASVLEGGYLTQTLELGQNLDEIKTLSTSLIECLDEGYARKAASPTDSLVDRNNLSLLRDKGTALYKRLFGKHSVNFARDALLAVTLPEELNGMPVELLHDDDDFWSLKYAIVRSIPSSQTSADLEIRSAFYGFNPSGDPVIQSSSEFTDRMIQNAFRRAFPSTPTIRFKHGKVLTVSVFLEMIANRDMLILTCHGEKGKLLLADSYLTASQLSSQRFENLRLFLNNACYSAEFLMLMRDCGLRNAHGFHTRVPQQGAANFAVHLLSQLGAGLPFGASLLLARRAMFAQNAGELVWANSMAIGDPAAIFRSGLLQNDALWSRLSRIQPAVRYAMLGAAVLTSAFAGFGIAGIIQTRQSEANLSARIQGVDEKLDALLAAYKVERGEPDLNPESAADFLRNARLAALSGDAGKARDYYRKYFAFGLKYLEPHQDYQRIMLESGEKESVRKEYAERKSDGDPFFVFLEALLQDEAARDRVLQALVVSQPEFGPAYGELLKIEVNRQMNRVRRNEIATADDISRMRDILGKARREAEEAVEHGNYLKYYLDRSTARSFGLTGPQETFLESYGKKAVTPNSPAEWTKDNMFSGIDISPAMRQTAEQVQPQPLSVSRVYDCSVTGPAIIEWFRARYQVISVTRDHDRTIVLMRHNGRSVILVVRERAGIGVVATITITQSAIP